MYVGYPDPSQRARLPIALPRVVPPCGLWLPSSSPRVHLPAPARLPIARQWRRPPQIGGWVNPRSPMRPGLGQVQTSSTQTISAIASTGASVTVSTLVALGTITGPVGAAIAGVIAAGMAIASLFKGCGQTCIEASDIANQCETVLQQNLQQYLSAPVHYQSLQTAALNNFTTAWSALTQACGAASLGSAGSNCISERQQGACSYKTTPGGWQQGSSGWTYVYPGANGSGSTCWNWFVGYHDPIANDPTVVPDPASSGAAGAASSVLEDIGVNPSSTLFGVPLSELAIPAAIAIALLLLFGGD
jgi:hypothetical protein